MHTVFPALLRGFLKEGHEHMLMGKLPNCTCKKKKDKEYGYDSLVTAASRTGRRGPLSR